MIKNQLFYQVLSDSKSAHSVLKYLTINELNSFMLTSSIVNHMIKSSQINELLIESSFNYLFINENKFDIRNKEKIHSAWAISDKLYRKFFTQSHFVIKCFYFSFLLLGVDLTSLLVACVNVDNSMSWQTQIPLIFHWLISVILLIVYVLRYRNLKRKMKVLIEKTISGSKEKYKNEMRYLAKKLKLRMKNKQPIAFGQITLIFIIFYFPVIIKLCMEKYVSSYRKAFWASSSLIFIYLFLQGLIKIILKKIIHRQNRPDGYKKIYLNGKSQFYKDKMLLYKKHEKVSCCGEITLMFSFFFMKVILYLVALFYLDCLGSKLDDFSDSYNWFVLFSPIYVILFFIVAWGILYCYSIRKYEMLYKGRLYATIILIVLSLIGNAVLIPLKLEEYIVLSSYWPFGIFCFATVSVFYHYYLLKIQNKSTITSG